MTDKTYGKRRWRLTLVGMAAFAAGCIGDKAIPLVCSTKLPGTEYEILLHGPRKGGYFYSIESVDGDCGIRELGPIDEPISPRLEIIGHRVFRITWGKGPNSAFATFDTAKHLIVVDSTKTSQLNRPFETPRYLRPGYRELGPNGEAAKKRRENRASQGQPAASCR